MSDESHKPGSAAVWHQWIEIAQLRLRCQPYAEGEAKSRSTEKTGQTSTTRAAEPVMVANQVSINADSVVADLRKSDTGKTDQLDTAPEPLVKMGAEMQIRLLESNQVCVHAEGIEVDLEKSDTEKTGQTSTTRAAEPVINADSIVVDLGKSDAGETEQLDTLLREIRERDTGVAPAPLLKMEVEPQHRQVKGSNQVKGNAESIEALYTSDWNIQLIGTTSGDTGASGNLSVGAYGKSCGSEERVPDKMNPASMVRAVEPPAVCIQNLAKVNEVEPSFPCNVPCHLFDGTWFNARKEPIVIQRLAVTFCDGSVGTLDVGLFAKRLGVRLILANDGYCGYYDLEEEQFAWDGGRGIWSARINSTLVDITEPDQQLQMAYAMDGMSYTQEEFEKFYGARCDTEWKRACEVTWQIRRCVVFLSEVGIPIDS